MLDRGYGFNTDTLGELIKELLDEVSKVNPSRKHPTWLNNYPTKNFIHSFARRNNLKYRNTMELTSNRVQVSAEDILLWFQDSLQRFVSDPVFAEIFKDPRYRLQF